MKEISVCKFTISTTLNIASAAVASLAGIDSTSGCKTAFTASIDQVLNDSDIETQEVIYLGDDETIGGAMTIYYNVSVVLEYTMYGSTSSLGSAIEKSLESAVTATVGVAPLVQSLQSATMCEQYSTITSIGVPSIIAQSKTVISTTTTATTKDNSPSVSYIYIVSGCAFVVVIAMYCYYRRNSKKRPSSDSDGVAASKFYESNTNSSSSSGGKRKYTSNDTTSSSALDLGRLYEDHTDYNANPMLDSQAVIKRNSISQDTSVLVHHDLTVNPLLVGMRSGVTHSTTPPKLRLSVCESEAMVAAAIAVAHGDTVIVDEKLHVSEVCEREMCVEAKLKLDSIEAELERLVVEAKRQCDESDIYEAIMLQEEKRAVQRIGEAAAEAGMQRLHASEIQNCSSSTTSSSSSDKAPTAMELTLRSTQGTGVADGQNQQQQQSVSASGDTASASEDSFVSTFNFFANLERKR